MSKDLINIIIAKLSRLTEYIGYLRALSKTTKSQFIDDYRIYGVAERYLQLCIEILLDVAKLVIIDKKLPRAESNAELFDILHKHKIISTKLHKQLGGIAGFRNILVHDYMKIDRKIVYENLRAGIKDFTSFKKAILKHLRLKL